MSDKIEANEKKPSHALCAEYVDQSCTSLTTTFTDHFSRTLENGFFSDITINYGTDHSYKLHSFILTAKSKWFASHCDGRKEVYDSGVSPAVHDLFLYTRFKDLVRFCYTRE
jgi:hypothetical protein